MSSSNIKSENADEGLRGFCIYIDTVVEGWVPIEWTDTSYPVVYPTREAAEREIAENTMERIQEFLEGEREFEDAMTVEEFVVEVDVLADGSTVDETGNLFGKKHW